MDLLFPGSGCIIEVEKVICRTIEERVTSMKTTPMFGTYGISVLIGLLLVLFVTISFAHKSWRIYRITREPSEKKNLIFWGVFSMMLACFGLTWLLRSWPFFGLAGILAFGTLGYSIGGGIRSQLER